jgi:hypothetical protein
MSKSTEPKYVRENTWKARGININYERYQQKVILQMNKCAICHKETKRSLDVDHDHITGKIRGLLCRNCNGHLGWYEKLMKRINLYLMV